MLTWSLLTTSSQINIIIIIIIITYQLKSSIATSTTHGNKTVKLKRKALLHNTHSLLASKTQMPRNGTQGRSRRLSHALKNISHAGGRRIPILQSPEANKNLKHSCGSQYTKSRNCILFSPSDKKMKVLTKENYDLVEEDP